MSNVVNIDVVTRLKQAADEKVAADPKLVRKLLGGGALALGGTGLGLGALHAHDEAIRDRARNTGFGAGLAAGIAGPQIVDALHGALHPEVNS